MKISVSFDGELSKKSLFLAMTMFFAAAAVKLIQQRNELDLLHKFYLDKFQNEKDNRKLTNEIEQVKEVKKVKEVVEEQNLEELSESSEQQKNTTSLFRFVVNTANKKYHTRSCNAAKKLAAEKSNEEVVQAENLEEAKKIMSENGYELCGLCDR